jgi:hypothetical protein
MVRAQSRTLTVTMSSLIGSSTVATDWVAEEVQAEINT